MSLPSLITEFEGYKEYAIYNLILSDDGYGGTIPQWVEGAHFMGTVTLESSPEMKIAYAQGVKGIYRVAVQRSVRLPWHTVFVDIDTGKTYRVTSRDESETPKTATIDIRYVDAEEYEMTTAGDLNG